MNQRKRSTKVTDSLKAERVQRKDAADLKAERVQLSARGEAAPSLEWRLETRQRLIRIFEYGEVAAARHAAETAREVARSWDRAPRIRRSGRRLTVAFTAPAGEAIQDVDLLRAALLEGRCG